MYEQNNVCTQLHQSDEKIHIILNNVPPVERNSPARRHRSRTCRAKELRNQTKHSVKQTEIIMKTL